MRKKFGHGPAILVVPALPSACDVKVPLRAPPSAHQHLVEPLSITPSTPSAPLNRPSALANTPAMADNTPQPVAPISRTTRPLSEALLNEKVQSPGKRPLRHGKNICTS